MGKQMTDGRTDFGTMTFRKILWGQETVCHTSRRKTGQGKDGGRAGTNYPRVGGNGEPWH